MPKELNNCVYKQKIFRFSLKTTIRKDAVKLAYRWVVILFDLEEKHRLHPNLFGEALSKMKTKLPKIDDLDEQIRERQRMLDRGRDVAEKIVEYEELENFDSEGNDEYLSQFEFSNFDIECYELYKKHIKNNPDTTTQAIPAIRPEPINTSGLTKDDVLDAIHESQAIPDEINERLKNIFEVWKGKLDTTTKTRDNIRETNLFIRFVGENTRIRDLTVKQVNEYKEFRKALPSMTKDVDIRSISELKNLKGKPNFPTTLHAHYKRVARFFNWCRTDADINYIEDSNIEERLKNNPTAKPSETKKRVPLNADDLKILFNHRRYLKTGYKPNRLVTFGSFKTSAMYWAPLIALFTGARQTEIIQLEKKDIVKQHDVWLFDINEVEEIEDENGKIKSIKNVGSRRLIPIHPQLRKLGFMDYYKTVKSGRLFPDEERDKKGKFALFQSRWGKQRKILGVVPKHDLELRDFHSFRHTVETRLNELAVTGKPSERFDEGIIDAIVGHLSKARSEGQKTYNHAQYIEVKSNALKRLKYDFIDFDNMIPWYNCKFNRGKFRKK